ncbi:hypothetical protein P7K49_024977 [Saguinus oedipus]|uniref:Uncharacterized protein n=1 Tax=Saguinus oedipus TaxID=9490 RepID=A0ABQ9UFV2_SAGOE|nr:hypothetical protein P7K49_024977 [Saguinus oedipus]
MEDSPHGGSDDRWKLDWSRSERQRRQASGPEVILDAHPSMGSPLSPVLDTCPSVDSAMSSDPDSSLCPARPQVNLSKVGEYWWNAILEGEEPIDIDKINKERSMATVDEEEQAVLDRLTFDYHQKLQGKPQSHELVRAQQSWRAHPLGPRPSDKADSGRRVGDDGGEEGCVDGLPAMS